MPCQPRATAVTSLPGTTPPTDVPGLRSSSEAVMTPLVGGWPTASVGTPGAWPNHRRAHGPLPETAGVPQDDEITLKAG